jgi:hypothetical protein
MPSNKRGHIGLLEKEKSNKKYLKGKKMKFWQAGNHENNTEILFLTSRHRVRNGREHLFHRNDFTTFIKIPNNLKHRIKYERTTGIYRTNITYSELNKLGLLKVEKN